VLKSSSQQSIEEQLKTSYELKLTVISPTMFVSKGIGLLTEPVVQSGTSGRTMEATFPCCCSSLVCSWACPPVLFSVMVLICNSRRSSLSSATLNKITLFSARTVT